MLERYSHIRMAAKREAVEALKLEKPKTTGKSSGVPKNSTEVETEGPVQ